MASDKHWCDYCGLVPHHKKEDNLNVSAVMFLVSGFFLCGATWLLLPLIPLIRAYTPPACPHCGAETRKATKDEVKSSASRAKIR